MKLKLVATAAFVTTALLSGGQAVAQEKLTVWWVKGFYKAEDEALFAAIKKYEDKHKGVKIGLISTQATMAAHIFDKRLLAQGYGVLLPSEADMQARVTPAILLVKANRPGQAGPLIEEAVRSLIARGASRVILACTETPVALGAIKSPVMTECIDPTAALARLCVAWWKAHSKS